MSFKDLNTSVINLPLIGEKRQRALSTVGVKTLEDLLYYVPRTYLDRTNIRLIGQAVVGEECTVVGEVRHIKVIPTRNRRKILKIEIADSTGFMTLNWFRGIEWVAKAFKEGDLVSVFGKVEFFRGNTMTHPDFDFIDGKGDMFNTGAVVPVYPLTLELRKSGLSSRAFRKLFVRLLDELSPEIHDPIPGKILEEKKLMPFLEAIKELHFPSDNDFLEKAKHRFKYQEALMFQSIVELRRRKFKAHKNGAKCEKAGQLLSDMYNNLPFDPTNAQKRVVKEIYEDLKAEHPMNRLLQGDVGCGKTLVAAMTAAIVTANGFQTAIMAPTEILANQHYESFTKEFDRLGVKSCLLTGKTPRKQRELLLLEINAGRIPIVIGTHALIQKDVHFKKLGLVIIDEQHRFGVDQRGALIKKGPPPHTLAMTATPIPRTLSMTLYGDMDISIIDEMPKGRIPVRTKVVAPSRLPNIYEFFDKEADAGHQIYVVYPLIAESEKMDLKAVENGYEELKEQLPHLTIAMLHGRTKKDEKNQIMSAFVRNEIDIMVSTTVIEVGVDNPNATVMLIENAERFGLSQLHQLRGRVGRGTQKSWCILVQRNDSPESTERLKVMEKTNDGFIISEEDMKQRGHGDIFGSRQHGLPELQFINMFTDHKYMQAARASAISIFNEDEHLLLPLNAAFREHFKKHYAKKLEYSGIG
ncbi:MAG: ATP-dependent DNA helicase RecG [Candidatus Neomarinimicrobiota bacterium]